MLAHHEQARVVGRRGHQERLVEAIAGALGDQLQGQVGPLLRLAVADRRPGVRRSGVAVVAVGPVGAIGAIGPVAIIAAAVGATAPIVVATGRPG